MSAETLTVDVAGKPTQVTRGGDGPPVVYLHSALGESDWLDFHERLAADHTVFVPAHPGFAESGGMDEIDGVADVVFHYDDLFTAMDIARPVLVGQSLGGWIAAEYAVHWPERLSGLVLIDAAGLRIESAPVADMWATRPPDLADLMFADTTHPLYMMMQAFQPNVTPPPEILVPFYKAQQATARLGWNPYLHDPKLESRLPRARVRARVLWGDCDRFIPVAHGERYAQLLPDATLEMLADCGHLPVIERPDTAFAAVRSFLEGS